jgi:hypothetical protein
VRHELGNSRLNNRSTVYLLVLHPKKTYSTRLFFSSFLQKSKQHNTRGFCHSLVLTRTDAVRARVHPVDFEFIFYSKILSFRSPLLSIPQIKQNERANVRRTVRPYVIHVVDDTAQMPGNSRAKKSRQRARILSSFVAGPVSDLGRSSPVDGGSRRIKQQPKRTTGASKTTSNNITQ